MMARAPAVILEPWATLKMEATCKVARVITLKKPGSPTSLELLYQSQLSTFELLRERKEKSLIV